MSEDNLNEDVLTDKSDSEIINDYEANLISEDQQNPVKIGGKRSREKACEKEKSEESSEEGFITMTRRRPKKVIRSRSYDNLNKQGCEENSGSQLTYIENEEVINTFEVCLTSLQVLPKQMALAKLLRSDNIQNIIKIKYKSPYKVFVQFDDKNEAKKLLSFPKNKELDIRAQFTDQVTLSYGLIKGVDLEMTEEEMLASFSSSVDIMSVRRLRRMDYDGKWVDSETVRLCFKNSTCPDYVFAYGCRFKVERYVFPVTQCSRCWKFGHHKKFCPIHKNLCPKCGKEHINCDTKNFTCLNCKGSHMALDKTCKFFIKEKRIRVLMSLENTTYKNALLLYVKEKKANTVKIIPPRENDSLIKGFDADRYIEPKCLNTFPRNSANPWETLTEEVGDNNAVRGMEAEPLLEEEYEKTSIQEKIRKEEPKIKKLKKKHIGDNQFISMERIKNTYDQEEGKNEPKERKFQWRKIWQRIKEIIFCEDQLLVEKITSVMKVICEEIKLFLFSSFMDGEMLKKLFSIYDG